MAENPLIQALPPAVDYLSYLSILEYNLSVSQLPVLHDVLQDTTLTTNIGWDLVHLLIPLLPASTSCLQDVARLGNPREVVLKVTEILEGLRTRDTTDDDQEEDEDQEVVESSLQSQAEQSSGGTTDKTSTSPHHDTPTSRDRTAQFCALLDMLAILHPRIKTKYPSRFLSTSLQSVLSAYPTLMNEDEATDAVLSFIKSFAGSKRPRLPPRKSSSHISVQAEQGPLSAPDPEASEEPAAPEEQALQQRLLQSFMTFAAEVYMSALPSDDEEVVAMAWSSRLEEQVHPKRNIPGRRTMREAFEKDEYLHRRDSIMGQMLALARDLHLTSDELVKTLAEPEDLSNENPDDLPSSASDVPLSRPGCLHLLCATIASNILFHAPSTIPALSVFPTFSSTLTNLLGDPSSGRIGTEPASLIDSLLFLGSHTFETSSLPKQPLDDDTFTNTLQRLSLLSANTPSAPLRYHAHILTSRLLHAHPDQNLRLAFIKDTLQHCPYENLKASAVGWLKDETLAALATSNTGNEQQESASAEGEGSSIFSTPACVETLSPHLFRDPLAMSDEEFRAHAPFFLAVLNFRYFLLLSSRKGLRDWIRGGGDDGWLADMEKRVQGIVGDKSGEGDGEDDGMALMEGVIGMCKGKVSVF
ncbi:MAG: hypothetical protein LQ348_007596 [Seirophora lacunosa]|nr:MAG: hypothetical protein LQ348_007596 [Seirophora lacunosa]